MKSVHDLGLVVFPRATSWGRVDIRCRMQDKQEVKKWGQQVRVTNICTFNTGRFGYSGMILKELH